MIWIATAGLFATITITIAMPMKTSKIGKNKRPAFSGTVHKETYQTLPDNMNEPDWGCERCAGRDAKPEDEPGADWI